MIFKTLTNRFVKLFVFISIFLLILSSCDIIDKIFGSGDDDITNDIVINSATIGTDGGVINADDLTLTIPAGAFSQSVDIHIYSSSVSDDSIDDIATKVYKIEGLPDQYSKPIDVSIKHNGAISEQSYLIVQEDSYIPSLDDISASNIYFDAVINGDSIKSQIPAITTDLAKVSSANLDLNTTFPTGSTIFRLFGISNRKNHTTSSNHFKIIYNTSKDDATNIIALGQYLEDAYTKIQGIGFSYVKRTKWPVSVYIEDLKNNIYGLHCPSRWGLNSYYLKFNRIHLSKQTELKTTAIHEFFHLVQYLYDNRNFLSRATFKPPHHWFNEACAVWSEELVMNSGYISDVRTSNTLPKPFTGLQAGSIGDATMHGYGMSAFVKYIVNKYGQNVLVNIYQKILDGRHVFDAINNSMNKMLFMDYNPFLQQYAQGQIYSDLSQDILVNMRDDTFQIETNKDTLKTFTANYKELSAKLYLVRLDYQNFKDDASLEISIDQDLCDITVFQYPKTGGTVSILAKGQKSCIVSDLKGIQKDKHLIVMVTNSNYISDDYTPSNKDIIVTMKVKNTPSNLILEFSLHIDKANFQTTSSEGTTNDYGEDYYLYLRHPVELDVSTDNVYRTTFNFEEYSLQYSGVMSVTFIDTPRCVNFHMDMTRIEYTYYTFHEVVQCDSIPYIRFNADRNMDDYSLWGNEVSNGISSIYYRQVGPSSTKNLISYTCGDAAWLTIDVYFDGVP